MLSDPAPRPPRCYDPATRQWREWALPGQGPQPYAVYVDDRDLVWTRLKTRCQPARARAG